MTDNFLSRWSRRKREATTETAAPSRRSDEPPRDVDPQASSADAFSAHAEPQAGFDLSKLPSLDSIGPGTDIRAFLRPGVPATLSRAALRRAWAADPGIRDFIGLAENAWDFTAPDALPGFGPLDPAEARQLFARLLGEFDRTDEIKPDDAASHGVQAAADASPDPALASGLNEENAPSAPEANALPQMQAAQSAELSQRNIYDNESAAVQNKVSQTASDTAPPHRFHGRALPR